MIRRMSRHRRWSTWIPGALLLAWAHIARAQAPETAGIPNFHQVTDRLYRGGQPRAQAWPALAQLGVRTVIDLRTPREHSTAAESTAVRAAGMRYVSFPLNGFRTPTASQMERVLALLDDSVTFVHCAEGRDRTGTVIAAYRISRQGWDNASALAEAHKFGLHWYERGMRRFIQSFERTGAPGTATTRTN